MDGMTKTIYDVYYDMARHVSDLLESLYEQKHAFYFRRVREWHEFHEVGPVYVYLVLMPYCEYAERLGATWLSDCPYGLIFYL